MFDYNRSAKSGGLKSVERKYECVVPFYRLECNPLLLIKLYNKTLNKTIRTTCTM